jgi:hypothetical protein
VLEINCVTKEVANENNNGIIFFSPCLINVSCASSDKVSRKVTSEESKEKVVEQDVNVKNDALMKRHLRNFELRVGN